MSSGHTPNRNGRGNQRRRHGPPRQHPQNGQSQNGQPRNGQQQQPRDGRNNTPTRPTPALSMTTALPARPEAPFQAPDAPPSGTEERVIIVESSVTREITEVVPLDLDVEAPAIPERHIQPAPRPVQQRNTQPPGKRGPILVSSERQNAPDNGSKPNGHSNQPGMQTSSLPRGGTNNPPHVQPAPASPFDAATGTPAPSGPPRAHGGAHDTPHPPSSQVMQYGGAGDTDDDDAEYVAPEHRPARDVRGTVGALIDSLHDLFVQDRAIASQGNATRCGICYLHYPLSELEYREVEGYYVCIECRRTLGPTHLMMVRRQQKN